MRKNIRLSIFILIAFFSFLLPVSAKEVNLNQLVEEIKKVEGNASYAYIVGDYVFTSEHILTTQDLMLASRTIKSADGDGNTKNDPIYNKMSIQTITKVIQDFQEKGWKVEDNLLGTTPLKLSESDKINIKYIDYVFVKEDTKMDIDIASVETTYKEKLRSKYNFDGNNANSEKLNFDSETNTLTGLVFRNDTVTNVNGNDKTNYYIAFAINIPNVKAETTINITGNDKVINSTYEEYPSELKTENGVVVLWPVKDDATDKTITVKVDYDGKEEIYDTNTKTINWQALKFQEDSKASFTLTIPSEDKDQLATWGYTVPTNEYTLTPDSDKNTFKLNGKVIQQHTNDKVFASGGEDGYYFAFNITPEQVLDSLQVTIQGKLTRSFTATDFTSGSMTHLFKLDPECKHGEDKSACKLDITINLDGNGNEYLPTKYTINYGDLIFEKKTKVSIEKGDDTVFSKLYDDYGWTKEDDYNPIFETSGNKVNVSGFIPIVDSLSKNNVFGKDHLTSYYLAYVIKLEEAAKPETTIKFIKHDNDEEKVITGPASFDKDGKELYVLKHLHTPDTSKTFDIEIDMDGSGEEYAPTKITIDWHKLVLERNSQLGQTSLATKYNISNDDYNDFINWNFDFTKNNLSITKVTPTEDNPASYKLSGTVHDQKKVNAFTGDAKSNYYVPIAIKVPNAYATKATFKLNTTKDGDAWKDIPNTEIHNNTLAVLFAIYSDAHDKKIKFQFDLDGPDNEYRAVTYYIDYSDLTFIPSHDVTFKYANSDDKVVSVYEDETLSIPQEKPTKKYHTFKYWSKDGETEYSFKEKITSDITLSPRWDIDTDEYVNDAVKAINQADAIKDNLLVEKDTDTNTIKITVKKPKTNSTLLTKDILQGILDDVFNKKEITQITVKYDTQSKNLTSADTASNQIQELLKEVITEQDVITFDDLINKGKELEISITNNANSVEINDTKYIISFDADYRIVDNLENLQSAIANKNVKNIYLSKTLTLEQPLEITMTDNIHAVNIQSLDEKATITNSNGDYVIKVNNGNINFTNLKITGNKTGILVNDSATVTLDDIDLSGNSITGVEVKSRGALTASKLTYNEEDYDHPVIKAEKTNTNVSLTNLKNANASRVEREKIITYEENIKEAISGDSKVKDTDYNYYNYYNKEEHSRIYTTQLYNLEGGYRVEFIRYSHYGDTLKVPSNDDESKFKIFTSFSYDGHNYTLLGFSESNNASVVPEEATGECKLPNGTKEAESIKITEDKAYFATFCMTMPEGTVEVSDKDSLLQKINDPKVTSIYIKENAVIDLTDQDALEINRKLTIVGRNSNATIKAKKINITADGVVIQRLTLDIKAENSDSLINISNSTNKVKFTLWQSTIRNSGNPVDAAIKYTSNTEIIADVRWNKFEAANINNTYINIDGPLGEGTDIYGNSFSKLSTDITKRSAITIKSFSETAKADVDEASDVRIGGNTFSPDDYAVKLLSSASGTKADVSFQYNSVKVDEDKKVNLAIEYTSSMNDFSGITFRVQGNNTLYTYYLDDGQEKDTIPSGTGINVKQV